MKPFGDAWKKSLAIIDSLSEKYSDTVPDSIMAKLTTNEKIAKSQLDHFLLTYVKQNPNSYVALWKLIQKFNVLGYIPIYSQIYNSFSREIKSTSIGKKLSEALELASTTSIGRVFPPMSLVDTNNYTVQCPEVSKDSKFIFLDFWFSHCGPCIAQFGELKRIYSIFKSRGFEMVSISVDKLADEKDWKEAINKYHLDWKHYWDIDGLKAQKLTIVTFPSNFLLDKTGKIILRNIWPDELDRFLKQKLHTSKQ